MFWGKLTNTSAKTNSDQQPAPSFWFGCYDNSLFCVVTLKMAFLCESFTQCLLKLRGSDYVLAGVTGTSPRTLFGFIMGKKIRDISF